MAMNTYLDFAENDYNYFMDSYKRGIVANAMAADAQEICEKYMKHMLDQYYDPDSPEAEAEYTATMKTHNLVKLVRFFETNTGFRFESETKRALREINGYYFTARYPGDESVEIQQEDLDICANAVNRCRKEILREIKQIKMVESAEFQREANRQNHTSTISGMELKNIDVNPFGDAFRPTFDPNWKPEKNNNTASGNNRSHDVDQDLES